MFTGISEEKGLIQSIGDDYIIVKCCKVLEGSKIGDSIAVNGVCLTLTELGKDFFRADVSSETFKVTALRTLRNGGFVNLERAMPADGRFGGHIVLGHVDGVAKIVSIIKNREFFDLIIELNPDEIRSIVRKGSITVNGISLTVAEITGERVKMAIIPHTFENTNLSNLKSGDFVNIEVDILAKYVEKFLSTSDNKSGISMDFLERNGFC